MNKDQLKAHIKQAIREIMNEDPDLREITTTGNIAGYQTPFAFTGDVDDEDDTEESEVGEKFADTYGWTKVGSITDNITTPEAAQDLLALLKHIDKQAPKIDKNARESVRESLRRSIKKGKAEADRKIATKMLKENFDANETREIERIIRKELAEVFFDLFQRRNTWIHL